mgnify:CR=1 FL=1
MDVPTRNGGWIEVVCGPMFSGKTEELIRRLKRAFIARQRVQVFKPAIDDRYADRDLASHAGRRLEAYVVRDTADIEASLWPDVEVVGIDEVQFFDEGVVALAARLAADGVRVICAGLDQDYRGRAFGPMPALLVEAEAVTKVLAICVLCGDAAHRSHRTTVTGADDQVLVGAAESYQPLCRACFARRQVEASQLAAQGRLPFGPS